MFLLSERIQDIYILTACAGAYAGNIEKTSCFGVIPPKPPQRTPRQCRSLTQLGHGLHFLDVHPKVLAEVLDRLGDAGVGVLGHKDPQRLGVFQGTGDLLGPRDLVLCCQFGKHEKSTPLSELPTAALTHLSRRGGPTKIVHRNLGFYHTLPHSSSSDCVASCPFSAHKLGDIVHSGWAWA